MIRSAIFSTVALGCLASVGHAQFFGMIDFEDGTTGPLVKEILVSNPQGHTVGDFGGPGNLELNLAGSGEGGFQSKFLVVDTSGTGAGDVYGDVTLQALYRPSNSFEFALAARVQEHIPGGVFGGTGSSGWGVWATAGTQGFAPGLNIAVELPTSGQGNVRASQTVWDNDDPIVISSSTWYDVTFSVVGLTATATLTELDLSFNPVPGRTATVSYTDTAGEMELTGLVGTRGAQNSGDTAGYLLDNFTVVPEPASVVVLGLAGLGLIRRRRNA
jgi:hypothetical protein